MSQKILPVLDEKQDLGQKINQFKGGVCKIFLLLDIFLHKWKDAFEHT